MQHSKLRIGIVGAGGIVLQRHLPALLAMPDVEVVAVSNATYASSERFCREHLPHATPLKNWAELVSLREIDIVWIGTPPYMHAPVSISALEAGRHVFCQARMAMNLEEAREMQVAARKRPHLVAMLCPPPHGMRGDAFMRKLLKDQIIGRPHQVRLQSFSPVYLDAAAPAHWRQRIELGGINVLTLGIYVEVLQRWLGPIRAVTARAKIVHRMRDHYEVRVPDLVTVLAEFDHGAEGVLEFSGVAAFAPVDRLEIYGDCGTLRYDFNADTITAGRLGDRAAQMLEIPAGMEREWTVEKDFITAVKNTASPRPHPTFDEGVAYTRVVQAVADSIAGQRRVEIAL
ncbi:MAG: Gfo/Idh/MocA family oxidoreductase [Verrucomicrobia bacterium]|nr:Gfo/Idh/MocA family oxidoreductase [Verrucomicrobiota bacterium]